MVNSIQKVVYENRFWISFLSEKRIFTLWPFHTSVRPFLVLVSFFSKKRVDNFYYHKCCMPRRNWLLTNAEIVVKSKKFHCEFCFLCWKSGKLNLGISRQKSWFVWSGCRTFRGLSRRSVLFHLRCSYFLFQGSGRPNEEKWKIQTEQLKLETNIKFMDMKYHSHEI